MRLIDADALLANQENYVSSVWGDAIAIQDIEEADTVDAEPVRHGACENDELLADALEYIQQLENHIGEFTEKVSQLEAAQPKWISVKDRLPDGSLTKCLVAFWSSGEFVTDIGFFCGEYGWDLNRWATSHIDYWMPMPEPPKEE